MRQKFRRVVLIVGFVFATGKVKTDLSNKVNLEVQFLNK